MRTTLITAAVAALLTVGLGAAFVAVGPSGVAPASTGLDGPVFAVGGGGFLQAALPPTDGRQQVAHLGNASVLR